MSAVREIPQSFTISLDDYKLLMFLASCQNLKHHGLIDGDGPKVNLEMWKGLEIVGKQLGWPSNLTREEIDSFARYFFKERATT